MKSAGFSLIPTKNPKSKSEPLNTHFLFSRRVFLDACLSCPEAFALDLSVFGYNVLRVYFPRRMMKSWKPVAVSVCLCVSLWLCGVMDAQEKINIAVVPKGAKQERWKAIHAGAVKAQQELSREGLEVNLIWKDSDSDLARAEQIQVVDTFTGQRLSGVLVVSMDDRVIDQARNRISENGVPMARLDSVLDSDQAISYVATDNFQAGVLAADRLGQLINGEGNLILLRDEQGAANSEAREAGFLERVKSEYPSIRLVSIEQHAGSSYQEAYLASEYLLNRYGRRVNGVYASSEIGSRAMTAALRDFSLVGQVFLVGSGASSENLDAVRRSEMSGLIFSDPFRMGYVGVTTLVDHLQGSNIPTVVDTGVMLVTQSNIDSEEISKALNPPVSEYVK